jgi:hypothetical protein
MPTIGVKAPWRMSCACSILGGRLNIGKVQTKSGASSSAASIPSIIIVDRN